MPGLRLIFRNTNRTHCILFLLLFPVFVATALQGCSTQSKQKANRVSDYDPEFNEDPVETKLEVAPDSIREEVLLEEAMALYDEKAYSAAKRVFVDLGQQFPTGFYASFAELKAADSDFFRADFLSALPLYEDYLRLHPQHESASYVKYQIANCRRAQYRGPEHDQSPLKKAISDYKLLLRDHPGSIYSAQARRRITEARERIAEHEAFVADFYHRSGLAEASAERYADLFRLYPESQIISEARAKVLENFKGRPELLSQILASNSKSSANKGQQRLEQQPSVPLVLASVSKTEAPAYARGSFAGGSEELHISSPTGGEQALEKPKVSKLRTKPSLEVQTKEFLRDLSCNQIDSFPTAIVHFHSRAVIALKDDSQGADTPGARRLTAIVLPELVRQQVPDISGGRFGTSTGRVLSCKTAGMRVQIEEMSIDNSSEHERSLSPTTPLLFAIITAEALEAEDFKLFALDRPFRIVTIAQ